MFVYDAWGGTSFPALAGMCVVIRHLSAVTLILHTQCSHRLL